MMLKNNLGKWLVLFALSGMAAACGKDDGNGDIGDVEAPVMVTDVESIVFVQIPIGETDTQALTVFNVGEGDLKISSVRLVETTDGDAGGQEFSKGEEWADTATLAKDESMRFAVKYAPGDESPDEGYIELKTNDPQFTDGIVQIPLETPALAPRIFSRENIIFRRVPPVTAETRDKFWQLTEVQNIGESPLQISDVVVSPADGDFRVSYPAGDTLEEADAADPTTDGDAFPGTLAPGESFPMRVYFNPDDDLPSTAEIVFYSNDPASEEYVVSLLGNSGSPCLQLSHEEEINFGEGGIGYANNRTIIAENCSATSDLVVSSIDVCTFVDDTTCDSANPIYTIKDGSLPPGLPDADAIIGPQDTASFVLTYTPEDLDVSTGELTVKSDDPAKSTLVVPIVGKGTNNACPTAVAQAKLADGTRWETTIATIPLKTIQFQSQSTDVDGTVDRYEWNIIQRPTNSTARMTPSDTVAEPSLFLDLAGEYVIELKVYDDNGTESCGDQAIITIIATPDEDVHVQLVWDTPTDNNQTDAAGTDLDLHFLHPNGRWNSAPWDIYWLNPTAEWGNAGASDDPSLDIDDTDGAGPENVNMQEPTPGLNYAVGVYYYADNGYGPSYATIRIFIRGVQAYEYRDMFLPTATTFWYAATISWPSGAVAGIDNVRQGFPGN